MSEHLVPQFQRAVKHETVVSRHELRLTMTRDLGFWTLQLICIRTSIGRPKHSSALLSRVAPRFWPLFPVCFRRVRKRAYRRATLVRPTCDQGSGCQPQPDPGPGRWYDINNNKTKKLYPPTQSSLEEPPSLFLASDAVEPIMPLSGSQ